VFALNSFPDPFFPSHFYKIDKTVAEIHDPHYLRFLAYAHESAVEEKDDHWLNETQELIPCNLTRVPKDKTPLSDNMPLYVQAGHYANDTMTPIVQDTWKRAMGAAKNTIDACNQMVIGVANYYTSRNSLPRPQPVVVYALNSTPGHHAGIRTYAGYCFINNAALAANYIAQKVWDSHRIMHQTLINERMSTITSGHHTHKYIDIDAPVACAILDLDYHCGDGTHEMVQDSDASFLGDMLSCSIHMHPTYEYPYFSGYPGECTQKTVLVKKEMGNGFYGIFEAIRAVQNITVAPKCDGKTYLDHLTYALECIQTFYKDAEAEKAPDPTDPAFTHCTGDYDGAVINVNGVPTSVPLLINNGIPLKKRVLIIPFGADTLLNDPDASKKGGMCLLVDDYFRMGQLIRNAFPALPILVTQEGGYKLDQVGDVVKSFLKGLSWKKEEDPIQPSPETLQKSDTNMIL
jgi:acetoin utilization deacetylase AcuC-like enzyme